MVLRCARFARECFANRFKDYVGAFLGPNFVSAEWRCPLNRGVPKERFHCNVWSPSELIRRHNDLILKQNVRTWLDWTTAFVGVQITLIYIRAFFHSLWTGIVNVIASSVTNRATGASCNKNNNNNIYLLHIRSEIVLARKVAETLIKASLAQIKYICILLTSIHLHVS